MKALPSSWVNAAQQKYPYKRSNVSIENLSMETHINCSNFVYVSPVGSKLRREMIGKVVYEVAVNFTSASTTNVLKFYCCDKFMNMDSVQYKA